MNHPVQFIFIGTDWTEDQMAIAREAFAFTFREFRVAYPDGEPVWLSTFICRLCGRKTYFEMDSKYRVLVHHNLIGDKKWEW